MSNAASRKPLALLWLFAVAAMLSLTACASLRSASSASGAGGSGSKDCASCKRMCEVAGDARNNPDAVAQCKSDCDKKCK
jgi:hypothetical protein